jgi:hypothetical protein
MLKVDRGSLISWMKSVDEVLTDELQILLERCLETEGEEHLRHFRAIYDGLSRGFPRLLWTLRGDDFHLGPVSQKEEECNWCPGLPLEEAHLCPKCWGSGIVKSEGMVAVEIAQHFLINPVRARLFKA